MTVRLARIAQAPKPLHLSVAIIPCDALSDQAAWSLWRSRPDKAWSLVDCASFVAVQQRGLREAITTDHHFEQAGSVRLLK